MMAKGRLLSYFIKNHIKVSSFSYMVGFIWILLIALPIKELSLNYHTYISENALLPGLVEEQYGMESNIYKLGSEIYEKLSSFYTDTTSTLKNDTNLPQIMTEKVYGILSKIGIEVYKQKFSGTLSQNVIYGTNVYAIKRASRTPSYDGMVIYTSISHLRRMSISGDDHTHLDLISVSALLSLMQYFTTTNDGGVPWIAKDIVMLVSSHDTLGPLAWTEGYYSSSLDNDNHNKKIKYFATDYEQDDRSTHLRYQSLSGPRSGYLQAALCLKTKPYGRVGGTMPPFSSIKFEGAGINGRLPNLDLLNVAQRLADKHGIDTVFDAYEADDVIGAMFTRLREWCKEVLKRVFPGSWRYYDRWLSDGLRTFRLDLVSPAKNLVASVVGLSRGSHIDESHAFFNRYGVDALTALIRISPPESTASASSAGAGAAKSRSPRGRKFNCLTLCRFLEGMVRCLNNLQEKFHQSYFFYLLTSYDRFVSIAGYYPAFVFLSLPLIIHCLYLWLTMMEYLVPVPESEPRTDARAKDGIELTKVCQLLFVNHAVGVLTYVVSRRSGDLILKMSPYAFLPFQKLSPLYTFMASCTTLVAISVSWQLYKQRHIHNTVEGNEVVKTVSTPITERHADRPHSCSHLVVRFVTTLELALGLYALSLINYSLALLLASTSSLLVFYDYSLYDDTAHTFGWKNTLITAKDLVILILSFPLTCNIILYELSRSLQDYQLKTDESPATLLNDIWAIVVGDRLFGAQNLRVFTLFCLPVWLSFCRKLG